MWLIFVLFYTIYSLFSEPIFPCSSSVALLFVRLYLLRRNFILLTLLMVGGKRKRFILRPQPRTITWYRLIHTSTCLQAQLHTYAHTHPHAHAHTHAHAYTHTLTHACTHARTHANTLHSFAEFHTHPSGVILCTLPIF